MRTYLTQVVVACSLAVAICSPALALSYRVTALGSLPGDAGGPVFMNSSGQVVGYRWYSSTSHAFLYTPGSGLVNLGTLPGDSQSDATGINDLGQVVGISYTDMGGRVFVYTPGVGMSGVPALDGADVYYATINNAGQIAGYDSIGAFLYTPGSGVLRWGTGGAVWALNNVGWAVGMTGYNDFLYIPGTGRRYFGSSDVTSYAMNDAGQVVGIKGQGWDAHAFVYSYATKTMVDLGTLPGMSFSQADDINNSGVVVGYSSNGGSGTAFVYTPGSGMTSLPALSGTWGSEAYSIDDAGRIFGLCGGDHVVMWTPIPEPASLLVLLAGLASSTAVFRRRRSG